MKVKHPGDTWQTCSWVKGVVQLHSFWGPCRCCFTKNVTARVERRKGVGEGRVSERKERAGEVAEGKIDREASKEDGAHGAKR